MVEQGEGKMGGRHAPELVNTAWTKTHQLEGDGMLPLLYHHLWKKNKSFQSCPGIKLPDTVVYEHNFPRAWYTYDFKNSEILKRAGRFLDTHHIYQAFSKTQGVDICAQYLFTSEGENGCTTSVEFMNPKDLEYFLNLRKSRPDGILQKFLPTASCNSQIQVIWSPRVTLIQRRVNKNRICGRNISAYQRAVTYDGPTHLSDEGLCSGRTKNQILEICTSIVEHFSSTEHKSISRFVIYFKVSPIPKQAALDGHSAIWLLWASSLRIGDSNKRQTTQNFRPLNLSPNISTESETQEATASSRSLETSQLIRDELEEVDHRQFVLSSDTFCSSRSPPTSCRRPRSAGTHKPSRPHLVRPKQMLQRKRSSMLKSTSPMPEEASEQLEEEWWKYCPETENAYEALKHDEQNSRDFVDETVYALYSHLLRKNSETFFVCVPDEIRKFFEDPTDLSDKLPILLSGVFGMAPYENIIGLYSPLPEEYTEKGNLWAINPEQVPPFGMQIGEAATLIDKLGTIKREQLKSVVMERHKMTTMLPAPPDKPPEENQPVKSIRLRHNVVRKAKSGLKNLTV
eukprot:TRINITY_DN1188_c4_g2_i1.p1 TRINITY_DN1188_c4_g2~~TRINITY_DN1188_c4_g2_i1.p1  ORF type:complete len:570 (+),score=105.78 TRINITY_DN1188_c4_g2_i1:49-1758(+)